MTARNLNYEDLFGDSDLETFARIDDLDLYDAPTDFDVQMYTNNYGSSEHCGDYISCKFDKPRNKVETATLVLKGNDPLVDMVMQCHETVVPITISNGGQRVWTGRVDTFDDAIVHGVNTVTCQLIGDWNWNNKVLCFPNFLAPIEAQFPTRALYIGPAISCILFMWSSQAFRLQSGIWELVNNIADPQAWFGTLEMGQDLLTPVAVNWIDPLLDTSKWVSYSGRMDTLATLVEQILKDNGLHLTIDLWLEGDPQPIKGVTLKGPAHLIVNCVDRSGVTGPTGSFIDGALFDLLDLENGVLGDVLNPFLNPANEYAPEGVNIAPTFGINFVPPFVIFNADGPQNGGIEELHFNGHHPLAYTVVGGGKSPRWMNDLVNATLEYLVDALQIAAGFTGIPSNVLDGIFDDVLLAFQEVENFDRRVKLGPFGYPEYFTSTGSSAYTLDMYFALRSAMWDSRGYHSAQITVNNCYPYRLGVDAIGDGSAQESPVMKLQRRIAGFEAAINIITMSTN
jgi:hypothetical protein